MMNTNVSSIGAAEAAAVPASGKALTIALWIGQLAVAGILGMMAFVKFFNYTPEGSMALAQALDVGRGVITLIGLVETAAVALIVIPRTRALGALLAVFTMLGALFSHATKIGWSGNAAAEMWPLALVVLAAASFVLIVRRNELPLGSGR
jgi:uncharacterized membrane protein YphA (DoxX/SURF4 family)